MRVLVCGGRDFSDGAFVFRLLDELHRKVGGVSVLIHGAARGADTIGEQWAKTRGIVIESYPANWGLYGKRAGPVRNEKMLRDGKPDLVVAFPGGTGTAHMVRIAKEAGIKVIEAKL